MRGQQVEVLEHEADLAVPELGALVAVDAGDVLALQEVVAGRRPVEQAEDVHERRLARARGAHDRDHRALARWSSVTPRSACTVTSPSAYERLRSTTRMSELSHGSPQRWRRWNCGLKGLLDGERRARRPRRARAPGISMPVITARAFRQAVLDLDELAVRDADAHLDRLGLPGSRRARRPWSDGRAQPAPPLDRRAARPPPCAASARRPGRLARRAPGAPCAPLRGSRRRRPACRRPRRRRAARRHRRAGNAAARPAAPDRLRPATCARPPAPGHLRRARRAAGPGSPRAGSAAPRPGRAARCSALRTTTETVAVIPGRSSMLRLSTAMIVL